MRPMSSQWIGPCVAATCWPLTTFVVCGLATAAVGVVALLVHLRSRAGPVVLQATSSSTLR